MSREFCNFFQRAHRPTRAFLQITTPAVALGAHRKHVSKNKKPTRMEFFNPERRWRNLRALAICFGLCTLLDVFVIRRGARTRSGVR
jgi:hypothetical protein